MRYVSLGAFFLLALSSSASWAQGECLATLNVRPERSVTILSIGPESQSSIATTMRCVDAERLRTDMFRSGQAISIEAFSQANALRQRIATLESELSAHRTRIDAATTRSARQTAIAAAGLTLTTAITAGSVAGCVTVGATCLQAVAGLIGIVAIINNMSDAAGDLASQAQQASSAIGNAERLLATARGQLNDASSQQMRLRYNRVFTDMCQSIRSQCM